MSELADKNTTEGIVDLPGVAVVDTQTDMFLVDEINRLIEAEGLTARLIADEAGIKQSTFSQWRRGKYEGHTAPIDHKVKVWLDQKKRQKQAGHLIPSKPDFFETPTSKKITTALTMAQLTGDMTAIYGVPGVGKTQTIQHYQETRPTVWVATMSPDTARLVPALKEIAKALGFAVPRVGMGAYTISEMVYTKIAGKGGLLVIDEAQHLSYEALEQVRAIHDRAGVGVALAGNENVYNKLTHGTRSSDFAQLFSRVGMRVPLKKSLEGDAEALARAWGIMGGEEMALVKKLAAKPGALRGVTKTLILAKMNAQQEQTDVTVEHIRQAWSNIGAME